MSVTYTNQTKLTEEFSAAMATIWSFETKSLEFHCLWNISDTDDVVKLCSEVQFQEYTQRTVHTNYICMTNTSHNHIDQVLIWLLNLNWLPHTHFGKISPLHYVVLCIRFRISHRYSFLRKILLLSLLFFIDYHIDSYRIKVTF